MKKKVDNWTLEECRQFCQGLNRTEIQKKSRAVWNYITEKDWFDEIIKKKPSKYTKEICENLASQCTGRTEFAKKYGQAYKESLINKWIKGFKWKEKE